MRKIHLGPELGELADGSDPAMSIGVATKRPGGTTLELSGLVHPTGSIGEQARGAFDVIEEVVCEDLDGAMADVTRLRFYVRDEQLTDENRAELHALRREYFDAPEYPAATMVGVASLVDDDADVEIEATAFVPEES
jgi:enamine deaminase RidA (YjgF/YER057c/UK114 family)